MKFSGTYAFTAPRAQVWAALNDPVVLQATIPGCESLQQTHQDRYSAHLKLRFGLLRFRTTGSLRVEVLVPAHAYRLHGQSAPTLFGAGAGVAEVSLRDARDGGTDLSYEVTAQMEGRLAKLGAGLVSSHMQTLGTRFFERFEAAMLKYL